MALDVSQTAAVLGQVSRKTQNQYDLVNGCDGCEDVTMAALSGLSVDVSVSLTRVQSNSLTTLEQYIVDNVESDQAETMLESLAALRSLLELGNEDTDAKLDPIFSLLAANPGLLGETATTGTVVDQLL